LFKTTIKSSTSDHTIVPLSKGCSAAALVLGSAFGQAAGDGWKKYSYKQTFWVGVPLPAGYAVGIGVGSKSWAG
jgi:hypothetical protein